MNERLFTMGVMTLVCMGVVFCFDTDGRYLQQIGLFWAGAVFGALIMGGVDVDN